MKNINCKKTALLRAADVIFAVFGLLMLSPLMVTIYCICWLDTGVPLLRQIRVGRNLKPFVLVKFRTMKLDTEQVPSHLVKSNSVTRIGSFMRRSKLDELPQLWNVLYGDMSIVGPRPGLPNQQDLTDARSACNVYIVRPGITGLAQISGINMSTPVELAKTDFKMINEMSFTNYLKIIFWTFVGKGSGDCINREKVGG